jgi:hypothetical protein
MKPNPIENVIFNHFRQKEKKQLKRIRKLKKDGYIVYKRKTK